MGENVESVERRWAEPLGADAVDTPRIVEEHTVKFTVFLLGELVCEAKSDAARAKKLESSGCPVGDALGHGAGASLADSIF